MNMIENILITEEDLRHCREVLKGLTELHRDGWSEAVVAAIMQDTIKNVNSLPRRTRVEGETYELAVTGRTNNDVALQLNIGHKSYAVKASSFGDLAGVSVLAEKWAREYRRNFTGELRSTLSSMVKVLEQRCPVSISPPGYTTVTLQSPGRDDKVIHVGTANLCFVALGIRQKHSAQLESWGSESMFSPVLQLVPEHVLGIFPRHGAPW